MTDDPFLHKPSERVPPVPPPAAPAQYTPPAYPPPAHVQPAYGPPPAYGPRPTKTWMNWTAFGCGIGSVVTCGLTSVPAIIFGHLGMAASKRGDADQRGIGIAGLVLGYVFLALFVLLFAAAPLLDAMSVD